MSKSKKFLVKILIFTVLLWLKMHSVYCNAAAYIDHLSTIGNTTYCTQIKINLTLLQYRTTVVGAETVFLALQLQPQKSRILKIWVVTLLNSKLVPNFLKVGSVGRGQPYNHFFLLIIEETSMEWHSSHVVVH